MCQGDSPWTGPSATPVMDSYGHSENRPRVLAGAVQGTERGRLVLVVRLVEHPCGRRVA